MNKFMEIKNLKKVYNPTLAPTLALRGINLDITDGSFTCLVGPSGHGKSTLLHLMGGLDRPTEGTVMVQGVDIGRLPDKALAKFRTEKLGIVFQFFNLLSGLTVLENVQLPMMYAGVPASEQTARGKQLLQTVGLSDKLNTPANRLSGGQMQRVAIARALANSPDILLMDEPTGNLDSASEAGILQLVHYLHQQGKTIVMVTHNMDIARQAQRIVKIKDGLVSTDELLNCS